VARLRLKEVAEKIRAQIRVPVFFIAVLSAALSVATAAAHGFGSASLVSVGTVVYVGVYSFVRVGEGVGAGDAVTYIRLGLVAYVAGFVIVRPVGAEAWFAAVCFVFASFLDVADGAVARRTRKTELGENLDAEADGLLTLVGVSVGVANGWLPVAYTAVGSARYVFVFGVLVRRRLGMNVAELDDSTTRKLLSSAQLFVITCALTPTVPDAFVRPAAYVVMVPFVVWFIRDWYVICRNPD